jgi:hypothetical protein
LANIQSFLTLTNVFFKKFKNILSCDILTILVLNSETSFPTL